jgi:peroxiredoxin
MSQAEIAGGTVTPAGELPAKGHRLHDFELTSALGRLIQLSDYRGRSNLVLIFHDDRTTSKQLLSDLAGQYSQIKNEEAQILAIVRSREQAARTKE